MDKMENLLPYLLNLKKVVLPQRISASNVLLYQSIKNELLSRKPPVEISFEDFDVYNKRQCFCYER